MRAAAQRELDALDHHNSFLATVGSVSPYIGLFGTVWGIMHAFIGLGNAGQATLATVAAGIAEALIATAIGLFAAIPPWWPTTALPPMWIAWPAVLTRLWKSFPHPCSAWPPNKQGSHHAKAAIHR